MRHVSACARTRSAGAESSSWLVRHAGRARPAIPRGGSEARGNRALPKRKIGNGESEAAVPVLMDLKRIIINEINDQQIIVLREVEGERSFPIVIGLFEAISIDRRIKG